MFGYFVWEGRVSTKIKEWGVEGEKYKTSLSPPPSDITSFLPISKKKKGEQKRQKKKTIQETFILLENSSMLHTSERKKGVG